MDGNERNKDGSSLLQPSCVSAKKFLLEKILTTIKFDDSAAYKAAKR